MAHSFRSLRRLAIAASLGTLAACHQAPENDLVEPAPETAVDSDSAVTIGSVRWFVDYEQAVRVAKEQGKPLWVHFGENPG